MRNPDHGERGCGRIGCCVPVHNFVRHSDPRFGSALGGGCGAHHNGVTCGWPEVAHQVADPAGLVTRPQPPGAHQCEEPAKCWADPDCPVYSSHGAGGQPTTTTAPYAPGGEPR